MLRCRSLTINSSVHFDRLLRSLASTIFFLVLCLLRTVCGFHVKRLSMYIVQGIQCKEVQSGYSNLEEIWLARLRLKNMF